MKTGQICFMMSVLARCRIYCIRVLICVWVLLWLQKSFPHIQECMQEIPGAAAQTGVSDCTDITASMSTNTEADGKHPESTEEESRE